ncbi:platelet-activating factor acetylhydrolase, isoform II-domain-containing protein [Dendryphion nanum]|uniref:1-alkyl-2-acetylglycerophosphocholine esterase n=1 Tax=Dendryphion nanum TaxID=256645 RepID=A0A9P9EJR1_9PLEO|nr:platelet-activating factor acetylhydrolase, isoform II-domain-containing protein [Dendryphion nanum]
MPLPAHITGVRTHESGRRNSAIGGTGKVPHSKKPRARPPKGIRDKVPGFGVLPSYSGPYIVGSMDIEVPVQNPRTFSHISRNGKPLLEISTVLFTLYYPATNEAGTSPDPSGQKKWSRETWLPRPRPELAKGYAKFAGISDPLAMAWFGATTSFTKLPAFRNAPVATHWPPEGNSKRDGYKIKSQQGSPPPNGSEEPIFPLLFFSHGLGGTRTAYSTMCGEFASYGFVVCALEHRDGSGPRTFVNHPQEGAQGAKENQTRSDSDDAPKQIKEGYDRIDYIFPRDNPMDTAPTNEKGIDSELRDAQIELRLSELEEAFHVLKTIFEGKGEEVAVRNLRKKGYIGSSSRGLSGIDWNLWKGRFHIDKVIVAGHSFGAATIVEVLRRADRFPRVQAGIIYDIWGAPIKPPEDDPGRRIHRPLLGINSEAFMYWQANFDAVMTLMNEAKGQGAPAYLCTVRGSIHVSQSDFSILYPHVCSFFLKATVHPQRAIDLNISVSLEFLRDVLEGAGKSIIERCLTNEELLQTPLLVEMPEERKPEGKWIGARLKVPHEFKTRLAARLQRKVKRKRKQGSHTASDELWMHFKPEPEALNRWHTRVSDDAGSDQQDDGSKDETAFKEPVRKNEECEELGMEHAVRHGRGDTLQATWLGQHPSLQQ